jgi:DNA repair ATPase RecN
MKRKHWINISFLVALASACAAPLPPVADQAQPPPIVAQVIVPVEEPKPHPLGSLFSKEEKKDEELFIQGMQQLAGPSNPDTFAAARQNLEALLNGYPQSKWCDAARTALRLMGELETYRQRLPVEQNLVQKLTTDKNRLLQENEQLKKDIRQLGEKYQTDTSELQQVNDQLKKDLQLLKNLEIQLDRREKTLR